MSSESISRGRTEYDGVSGKWCERSFRANLIDMHIADWDKRFLSRFDSEHYADMLSMSGVDTAYVYASSCLGLMYWPAGDGGIHPGAAKVDLLGATIEACRKRGLNIIVYFNYWSKWACENHPDWQVRTLDGKSTLDFLWNPGHYGVCCPNSPYGGFVKDRLGELCSLYAFDGLWIDMISWPYCVCYCDHCRERYMSEHARPLPETVDWTNPEWVCFQRARERWLGDYIGALARLARKLKPGVTFGYQSGCYATGWLNGVGTEFFRHADYPSGDFYGGAAEQSFTCKFFHSVTNRQRYEFMISRCTPDLTHHTTMKSESLLEAQVSSTLAHNGRSLFIDAIDPAGTLNPMVYSTMKSVFDKTRRFEPFLDHDAELCADVAVWLGYESLVNFEDNGRRACDVPVEMELVNRMLVKITRNLACGNIPHAVITAGNVGQLDRFRTIILSDVMMMDDVECEALRRYVHAGGTLYASRNASLFRKDGTRRDDFGLADVFGVSYAGETVEQVTYLAPRGNVSRLFSPYTAAYPLQISESQSLVRAGKSARTLAALTLPYDRPDRPDQFAAAISMPPGRRTRNPSVVINTFGKGKVVYVAGTLERMTLSAHRECFLNLLSLFADGPMWFSTDAPYPVEITLFRSRRERRMLVCAVNYQVEQPNIPVRGMHLQVRMDGRKARSVMLLPDMTNMPFEQEGDTVAFTCSELSTLQIHAIDY